MGLYHLEPPPFDHGASDGQGWNRLHISQWTGYPRCVLRPLTFTTLWESLFRRGAADWGSFYGHCIRAGQIRTQGPPSCGGCPITTRRTRIQSSPSRVLVRAIDVSRRNPDHQARVAHLLERAEDPITAAQVWRWEDLLALRGWNWDGRHLHDGISPGFWIIEAEPGAILHQPGPPPGWHVVSRTTASAAATTMAPAETLDRTRHLDTPTGADKAGTGRQ